ncbi:DUF4380 domain-containing protein [Gilvimarinus sp. 1_MG-2023]|uniref:DUF4380 domain-containing protein n=1 Tax=Gilvimarinus sp. 1_MG-2023 TaxID=3062638 RepID=UPI0026E2868B|nr:DUF4380 domain-containing protein [Gilvimarinus sp. 1_MG-2023]MDO6747647.1 DUF4380 domain-containing protein [Gilvimarinus sp. 1_MG-2023]
MTQCSDKNAELVAVTPPDFVSMADGRIYLERGSLRVTINPGVAGRIESLVYAGRERLLTPAQNNPWGNVLWTSPQSDWGWPPPEALNSAPYRVELTSKGVYLHGPHDSQLGVAFSKFYTLADDSDRLIIQYQIHNKSDAEVTLAPWEVTRLPAQGQVFFPKGETDFHSGEFSPLNFTLDNGIAWFDTAAQNFTAEHHKSMTDGEEGWLAYQAEDWLFVKVFEKVPAELIAPSEGEIELYAKGDGSYIEMEQQGYLTTLMPGETLPWQVSWVFASLSETDASSHREGWVVRARQLARLARNNED